MNMMMKRGIVVRREGGAWKLNPKPAPVRT